MANKVLLTRGAARDLEDLYEYILENDGQLSADVVLTKLEKAFNNLSESPDRGAFPKELRMLGIRQYREVFFKPYRIIYRTAGNKVYVMLIADGRRDMQLLLQRRLLDT